MTADCLVVIPPFSPNNASPPLGPATLKAHLEYAGFSARYLDLNISYISQFQTEGGFGAHVIGDHNNDEARIAKARAHFIESLCLPDIRPERVPSCDDANSSLPHDFTEIADAVAGMQHEGFWPQFFDECVFGDGPPTILGISIMGPMQVPIALLLARQAKQRWPRTLIVAGGSHVTLLAHRIACDIRYGGDIDLFLPGHSEHVLVELMANVAAGGDWDVPGVLRAGQCWQPAPQLPVDQRLPPSFQADGLVSYRTPALTLPIQLGRGCGYGRCTYCTYPVVEGFERISMRELALRFLPTLLSFGPNSISVRDSLFTIPSMRAFGQSLGDLGAAGLDWSATTKCTRSMTPEAMRELREYGCSTLEMGIETIHASTQRFFDKPARLADIERVLQATIDARIAAVVNLIYGAPGETIDDAFRQFAWWQSWKRRYPKYVFGVHNILQIDEGSPLAATPDRFGLILGQAGPWAFTFPWNAPTWGPEFVRFVDANGGRSQ